MLIAELNGRLIQADEVSGKSKRAAENSPFSKPAYHCPSCHESVVLKHGQSRIAHFSHLSISQCPYSENESQAHLAGKMKIKQDVTALGHPAVLEHVFSNINQRADVYVPTLQTVIEYQCSPISFAEIKRRTAGYHQVARRVLWILGARYNTGTYHSDMVARFAQYHCRLGFYFICFSKEVGYYCLHYQIREVAGKLTADTQNFFSLKALLQFLKSGEPTVKWRANTNTTRRLLLHQLQNIQRSNLKRGRTWLSSVSDCYAFNRLFVGCPMICHGHQGSGLPIFHQSILCWRGWLILRLFDDGYRFISDDLLAGLLELSREKFGLEFAQINDNHRFFKMAFKRLLIELHDQGYLRHSVAGIQILKQPVWFDSYDQKRWFILTADRFL